MSSEQQPSEEDLRSTRRRKPGVNYRLRVIKDSGGMLELVEEPPQRSWFAEWARMMPQTPWGL